MKSAVGVMVGRPSSGKSSLLNALCGRNISIVGSAPQTTRNAIRGILTEARGQLVLLDTPGLHDSDKKLNLSLKGVVRSAMTEVDLIVYVIDSTRPPAAEEHRVIELLRDRSEGLVVAVTKIDVETSKPRETEDYVRTHLAPSAVVPLSAHAGEGLERLRDALFAIAPEGEQLYDAEFYTDQPPEFRAAEIIREKAIERVREEVPHALYVEIEDMEEQDEGTRLWIRAVIAVERESQKGILIGRGGALIRSIRIAAQKELSRLFPQAISLDIRVKVQPKWRRDDQLLKRLIY